MKKPRPLKTFRVYFSVSAACVTIKAASKKEARIIAQDNYERGELTVERCDEDKPRLLPEGRSIEAVFYDTTEERPFISDIDEEGV